MHANRLRWLFFFALFALSGCTRLFFQPDTREFGTPERWKLAYQDVWISTNNAPRLHGWFLPAEGAARGTVYFLHGNAENISTHIASVFWLPARGYNVFLLDYRGYGRSEGRPSMAGLVADVERGLQHVFSRPDIDPDRVVVFGQSLGGSLAIHALAHSALRPRVKALIVDSAFSDYRRITFEKMRGLWWLTWPLLWLPYLSVDNQFSPMHSIARISPVPLLILHGDSDRVVPVQHGQALYAAATAPKRLEILPGLRHIESMTQPQVRDLLEQYLRSQLSAKETRNAH